MLHLNKNTAKKTQISSSIRPDRSKYNTQTINQTWDYEWLSFINLFNDTGLFLYPLKTSENLWFSNVFRKYRERPVVLNEWNLW